jgi:hypothetical protein
MPNTTMTVAITGKYCTMTLNMSLSAVPIELRFIVGAELVLDILVSPIS